MRTEIPKISFVCPNYNDSKTIGRYIDSIADQDWPNKELIIVDDGSTDDSRKVLEEYQKKYPELLQVYFADHGGACNARNIGASHATGKYISFLPADAYLYPGVARTWVEKLEDHPDYDFLYGGYKFTDDNYHELYSYLGDEFDPYTLKITNYIDGSYPLKKELFDKMGGWDTSIKSLQDWDFWLNAVINHNAKGLYIREVFFETTYPHPGGLSHDSSQNWLARTKQIKDKYNIPQRKICVASQGATFHAKNMAKYLEADFLENPSFKPHKYEMIYVIGFFGNVAEMFHRTRALRVVHWIGSDILGLQSAKPELREQVVNWINNNVDINLCEFEKTQKELEEIGIKSRIQPIPPEVFYKPLPLPEKFAVAVYLPMNNKEFYQPTMIYDIARSLPEIDFYIFGDSIMVGDKDNIHHVGRITGKEKDDIVAKTSMILRLTPHDGLPLSAIEWIMAGRQALCTVPMKYGKLTKMEVKDAVKNINKIKENITLNNEGSKYYSDLCLPENFKNNIYKFFNFDMKEWWKNFSNIWAKVSETYYSNKELLEVQKQMKELKPKTIIDIGCGTGSWSEVLMDYDYTGVDFSEELIKIAKDKYPDKNFFTSDILNLPNKIKDKYDVAFTFTCLLHVIPEEIEKNVESLKKIANYGVFIEPVKESPEEGTERQVHPDIIKLQKESDFIFNVKYTFIHDYMKYFNVIKVIQLPNNRNMFIVDLTK